MKLKAVIFMANKIKILLLTLVLVATVAVFSAAAATIDQTSSLNGVVLADSLVKPGDAVKEGQVLVKVSTIAGPAPAARATTDGRVASVLVQPGQTVKVGQVLVRLENGQ